MRRTGRREIPAGDCRMERKGSWVFAPYFPCQVTVLHPLLNSGELLLPQPQVLPGFSDTPASTSLLLCALWGATELVLCWLNGLWFSIFYGFPVSLWHRHFFSASNIDSKHKLYIRCAKMLCSNIKQSKGNKVCMYVYVCELFLPVKVEVLLSCMLSGQGPPVWVECRQGLGLR